MTTRRTRKLLAWFRKNGVRRRTGAYFVGSAEGTRSSRAIRELGPEEHKRQVDKMVAAIREGNRRGR